MSKCLKAAAVVLAISSTGCSIDVRGEETVVREEKRFTVSGAVELDLRTFDGAIDVRSWDRDEVLVEIQRRAASGADAEALQVSAMQEGNRIAVEARSPAQRRDSVVQIGGWRSPSVSYVVTAPRRATLQARTGDGPIVVRAITGTVSLDTGDGPVRAEQITGSLQIRTGDGPVALTDLQGGLDVTTGDGGVEVSGVVDALRVTTGDGPVRVDARAGSVMKSEWTVTSGDGPITVHLPARFDAEISAFTGDGPITVSGIARATPSDNQEQSSLNTRLGNGGQAIRLRTGDGAIAVTQ